MFNDYEYEGSNNGLFFQGQIYDDQYYGSTVISEFDLACGEEWKIPFVESSSFVGIMIAAMSFGLLGWFV